MTMKGCGRTSAISSAASSPSAVAALLLRWPRIGVWLRTNANGFFQADGMKRGCGRFDIGDARARRDQAQVSIANGYPWRRADTAGGVDNGQRHAAAVQRLQSLINLARAVDRLDQGLGIDPAALPVR